MNEDRGVPVERLAALQGAGILSGFAAGAWLGAAEAPTKLVTAGISPFVVSLAMVAGVFLARWTIPSLIHGTAGVAADLRRTPHLVVWAVLAGCLWAVANTLTVFAIRDIGLAIAFPLWNSNSLLGILWGVVFFGELRGAGRVTRAAVVGGALLMFAGATTLAAASAAHSSGASPTRGIVAALTAGLLWGTMYIPYRKAYLSGMNPLSFVTFFTVGELGTMSALALSYTGGVGGLWTALSGARAALFWLLLGGFVWVVGDLFQQFAAKYAGISRGIPLSNTNQLWGLAWGILVFGELRGAGTGTLIRVVGGSAVMALGALCIARAAAGAAEHASWRRAAQRESERYGVDVGDTERRLAGEGPAGRRRGLLDWGFLLVSVAVFGVLAAVAARPALDANWRWAAVLVAALVALFLAGGARLWRTTRLS